MRVLVADDHSLFRDGIASLLEAAGFEVVGQVGDGGAAVEAARRLSPDVVLMDIAMPGMSGLQALRALVAERPEIKVVMLTVSEAEADLLEAVRAGAHGYLLKNLNADEFLTLLHGLERGAAAMTPRTTARLLHGLAENARQPSGAPALTEREVELLQHVADGRSNKAIASALSLSENTVKYHMKNILQKLGAQNRTEAVTQAMRAGLLASRPPA
ncbi:MAG: response regulator transcription factor [Chloroflexi bacterium]|nr:response regulator transcription factor [Chloroflexota bacterium]